MLKRLALVTALLAGSAWAQQEISITAKDIETGAADAKLAELGRQAAATGKEVVINAPKEWHGAVAAKVKAGGAANVKLNDSFFENVVVRVADKPKVEPPKPAEAPKPAAAPAAAPAKPVEAPKPAAPAKPVEAPRPAAPPPAPEPAPVETPPPPPAPVVETPPPAPPPAAKPVEAPKPALDTSAAARQRFEKNLNGGKPAKGELAQTSLQKGDIVYIDGDVRAIVRRDSLGTTLYWLTDELNLQRAELKPLAENRYEVVNNITSATDVSLRGTVSGEAQVFQSAVPAEGAAERAEMEKLYAEGRPVGRSLRADQLRQGDIVYLGKTSAVIVRRDGGALARYWLDGPLNTNQVGLQKEKGTGGKFKVLSDNIQ
jgi:hypothetical protein